MKDSPPPSPQKNRLSPTTLDIHNGVGGKGPELEPGQASNTGTGKQAGRGQDGDQGGEDQGSGVLLSCRELEVLLTAAAVDSERVRDPTFGLIT